MEKKGLTLTLKLSWWFRYLYMPALLFFCKITNSYPDDEKLSAILKKAIKIEG